MHRDDDTIRRCGDDRSRGTGPAAWPGLSGAFVAALVGVTVTTATASPSGGTETSCTAEFRPDTLTIRDRPARVLAKLSQNAGDPRGVNVPVKSGLEVRETRADPGGRSWILGLYLGNAAAGAWPLELQGTDASCEGTVTIRMPGLE